MINISYQVFKCSSRVVIPRIAHILGIAALDGVYLVLSCSDTLLLFLQMGPSSMESPQQAQVKQRKVGTLGDKPTKSVLAEADFAYGGHTQICA